MPAQTLPRRLVIVANRLPFSVTVEGGALRLGGSPGGVASGLKSYLDALPRFRPQMPEYHWVGWPGAPVGGELQNDLAAAAGGFHSTPVLLSEAEMEQFYQGFCNKTIWPLFHYFPTLARFDDDAWRQYRHVNEVYCDAVLGTLRPGDVVWVHDYHLMLLPGLLRRKRPGLTVGFFLHIPFPDFEIFRLLPDAWRKEILAGIDKGVAALRWLTQDHYDFIFAAGDDWTDEDMFAVLPEASFSIRVGYLSSRARFNLGDTEDVLLLLEELAGSLRPAGLVPGPNS